MKHDNIYITSFIIIILIAIIYIYRKWNIYESFENNEEEKQNKNPININISFNRKRGIKDSNIIENNMLLNKKLLKNKKKLEGIINYLTKSANYENKIDRKVINDTHNLLFNNNISPVLYTNNNKIPQNYATITWNTKPDIYIPNN